MKPINGKITPCCSKVGMKKGPWTAEEDDRLSEYVKKEGEGRWRTLPKRAGLLRCGKSCRLRWMNYLRPSVKRGRIAPDEEDLILRLHRLLGNRWSLIAGRLPGRTDNEIKNYWNTHLRKKLISQGIDPRTHKPLNPNEKNTEAPPPSNTTEKMWMPSRIDQATSSADITSERNPNSKYASTICTGMSKQERNGLLDVEEVGLCAEDVFTSFFDSIINEEEAFSCGSSQHLPGNGKSSEGLVSAATQHGS